MQQTNIVISMIICPRSTHRLHELMACRSVCGLRGILAQDEVTPAVNLKLLTNNVRSQQEPNFPKGQRIDRVERQFLSSERRAKNDIRSIATENNILGFDGNAGPERSKYRVHKYSGKAPKGRGGSGRCRHECGDLATEHRRSTYGYFVTHQPPGSSSKGNVSRESSLKVTGIGLPENQARRQCDRCFYSLMTLMSVLAWSLLAMVFKAASGPKINLVPLTVSISLIFGFAGAAERPAWRAGCGAFGDYVSFHLGRNYRGVVGRNYHMEVAAALQMKSHGKLESPRSPFYRCSPGITSG